MTSQRYRAAMQSAAPHAPYPGRSPLRALAVSAIVLGLCSVAHSPTAHAQAAHTHDAGDDLAALQKDLADQQLTLSTADCMTACRALGSIRRVADRICALDPGEPCTSARAKAEDATRRVREACPDCAIAALAPPPPKTEERTMVLDSGPPAESKRGGCAGCTTATASPSNRVNAGLLFVALLALVSRLRGRRR
jgi:hypothetical protein